LCGLQSQAEQVFSRDYEPRAWMLMLPFKERLAFLPISPSRLT